MSEMLVEQDVMELLSNEFNIKTLTGKVVALIKKHNTQDYFNPNSPLNAELVLKLDRNSPILMASLAEESDRAAISGLLITLNISVNMLWGILHEVHYGFCTEFLKEFGFFPIFLSPQQGLDMQYFNAAFDAFLSEHFITEHAFGSGITPEYIDVIDYFIIYKRYCECIGGEHGETVPMGKTIEKGKYKTIDEVVQIPGSNILAKHIPMITFDGIFDMRHLLGDVDRVGVTTINNYFKKNYAAP